jgi:hypothetical protein
MREGNDMTDRLPAADLRNMVGALRAERTEMLTFTRALSDGEWAAPSAAKGWRIADVVAHLGALRAALAPSLERANEEPVARRRDWSRARVMAEYEGASRRATTVLGASCGARPSTDCGFPSPNSAATPWAC